MNLRQNDMAKAFYRLAEQFNRYGFFGEVNFEFELTENHNQIVLEMDETFKEWYAGIIFGTNYFIEHCPKKIGLSIRIISIDYNEVDTTNTIIAYLIYSALCEEIKLPQTGHITFEKDIQSFVFYK